MDYTYLGQSDLKISKVGFGCCPMGKYGWGVVTNKDLIESVAMALDKGINLFDTADIYGLGESEKILGMSLRGRRQEAVIATKFGVRRKNGATYHDNSPGWMVTALHDSLKRLNTDYIDLYQLHNQDNNTPLSDVIEVLERMQNEGKIRYYGLSNMGSEDIKDVDLPKNLISFQFEYSLSKRNNEKEILNLVEDNKLGFLSWGSLGQGILSGKYGNDRRFPENDRRNREVYVNFYGEKLKKNMTIVKKMKEISIRNGKSLSQIAIRWILDHLGFGCVLVGVKKTDQLIDNAGALGWRLSKQDVQVLNRISR